MRTTRELRIRARSRMVSLHPDHVRVMVSEKPTSKVLLELMKTHSLQGRVSPGGNLQICARDNLLEIGANNLDKVFGGIL